MRRVALPPTGEEGSLPDERKYVCIALCGDHDFFSMKALWRTCWMLSVSAARASWLMRRNTTTRAVRRRYTPGEKLGELGEVHPDVCATFDIGKRVYIAELDINT